MSDAITLTAGDLTVEVWPLGARLNGVWYRGLGNLLVGANDREEALGPKTFFGAVVGPVANRIAGGRFEIGGKSYEVPRNENGKTTLHGGPQGLQALDWDVAGQSAAHVTFALDLPDGFGGIPGDRLFEVTYRLAADATLEVSMSGAVRSGGPTFINLALHPYWCLDAGGRDGLTLAVAADHYTPIDADKIPTGKIADVTGTAFDLRRAAEPSTAIDHNFCLDAGNAPQVTLQGRAVLMEIATDAPGLQVFTGKPIGIAIEPQHWPDSMHHPNFPTIEVTEDRPFRQRSVYRFGLVEE